MKGNNVEVAVLNLVTTSAVQTIEGAAGNHLWSN